MNIYTEANDDSPTVNNHLCRDKATLSSTEIKPIALSIVEQCLAEGIRNSLAVLVRHSQSQKNVVRLTPNPLNKLLKKIPCKGM